MYCKLENVQMVQCGLIYKFNPFHVCSVAENTTVINHTGKLIFFMRGGFIVGRITYCHCIQYVFFITIYRGNLREEDKYIFTTI